MPTKDKATTDKEPVRSFTITFKGTSEGFPDDFFFNTNLVPTKIAAPESSNMTGISQIYLTNFEFIEECDEVTEEKLSELEVRTTVKNK